MQNFLMNLKQVQRVEGSRTLGKREDSCGLEVRLFRDIVQTMYFGRLCLFFCFLLFHTFLQTAVPLRKAWTLALCLAMKLNA